MDQPQLPAPPARSPSLPPEPGSRPFLPFPPPPRTAPARPAGAVPGRRRPGLVVLAVGVAIVLFTGVGAVVVASDRSRGDARPLWGGERSHAFIGRSETGVPFRWDPCSPIRYQVDLGGGDDRVLADVEEAIRRTSEASGLAFEFDGLVRVPLDELVTSGDFVTQTRDGLHWSPLLIAFRPQRSMRELGAGRALGVTFPVTSRFDADQFVSGAVVVNTGAGLRDGFAPGPSIGTVLQHELGHAVGLGHILDPFQLMSPMPIVGDWGMGDRAGLRRLGRGPCQQVPTAEFHAAVIPTP